MDTAIPHVNKYRCARCHRPMLSGESIIRSGSRVLMLGPKCMKKMFPTDKKPRKKRTAVRQEIDQLDLFSIEKTSSVM